MSLDELMINHKLFLNKTNVLFGGTDTGKSTYMSCCII